MFVCLFLYIFKPTVIVGNRVDFNFVSALVYGFISFIVTTLILLLFPKLFPKQANEEKWTVGKEMLLNLSIILFIALFINLYGLVFLGFGFKLATTIKILWLTILIGVVPVFSIVLYNQNRWLKKNLENSKKINTFLEKHPIQKEENELVELVGEGKKDIYQLMINDIVYITAQANYCEIRTKENRRVLIRISLTNIEKQLENFSQIIRVHRSYLINTNHVQNVKGNAQGYKLVLNYTKNLIPVARSKSKLIADKLTNVN